MADDVDDLSARALAGINLATAAMLKALIETHPDLPALSRLFEVLASDLESNGTADPVMAASAGLALDGWRGILAAAQARRGP